MARGALTFRQRDATALIKAAVDAGLGVIRVEVDKKGKIVVHTDRPDAAAPPPLDVEPEYNPWDDA